jgi:hypothetical protein
MTQHDICTRSQSKIECVWLEIRRLLTGHFGTVNSIRSNQRQSQTWYLNFHTRESPRDHPESPSRNWPRICLASLRVSPPASINLLPLHPDENQCRFLHEHPARALVLSSNFRKNNVFHTLICNAPQRNVPKNIRIQKGGTLTTG